MGYYESWMDAMNRLAEYGDYKSPYEQQLTDAQNTVNNWNYDYANDPSYQAYEQLYTQKGKTAMQDTLGQVSARTGGLASSYAQSAANQSYNNYMQQLAAQIPTLENQAYGRAYNNLQNWQNQDQTAYSRWKDQYAKLQDDANFWYNWYLQDLAAQGYGSGGGGGGYSHSGSNKDSGDDGSWAAAIDQSIKKNGSTATYNNLVNSGVNPHTANNIMSMPGKATAQSSGGYWDNLANTIKKKVKG